MSPGKEDQRPQIQSQVPRPPLVRAKKAELGKNSGVEENGIRIGGQIVPIVTYLHNDDP